MIQICDREEVTDCMVVQRFCWNDRRPVFETTSKSLYIAFSTAVDDPLPSASTIMASSTSRDVIGFRATIYFRGRPTIIALMTTSIIISL